MGNGLVITGMSLAPDSITPAMIDIDAAAKIGMGVRVDRTTAALVASGTAALFNVVGWRVKVIQVIGYITTVIQTQACNLKLAANPTAAGTSMDLCADLNVTAAAAFSSLYCTGTAANAMLNTVAVIAQATNWIVSAGTIDHVTSATNTGSVQWSIWYYPIDEGATITAA